nr:ribonuclease H-like domain-containing protein [Tanacetum cinerariifolium]
MDITEPRQQKNNFIARHIVFLILHREVIINGDSPIPSVVVEGAATPAVILTAEQKLARRNELKAREKCFGGSTESKKVQKTLLKQQFENFTGSSFEDLDQIHDRLQKLVSQLEIHGASVVSAAKGYLPLEGVSASLSLSCPSDRVQPSGGYNVVPPPITWNFMLPKPDFVFNTAPLVFESDHLAFNVQLSPAKPAQPMSHTTESMAPIVEDWVSDSEDKSEPNDSLSAPSFVQPSEHVKLYVHSVQPVEAPILDDTPKPTSSKTNGSRKRKNRKTCFVYRGVDHLIKDCSFHTKPKSQPIPRNSTYRGYDKEYASSTKKYP